MYFLIEKSGSILRISETDFLASSSRPSSLNVEARPTCIEIQSALRLLAASNASIAESVWPVKRYDVPRTQRNYSG